MPGLHLTILVIFLSGHLWSQSGPSMFSGTGYLSNGEIGILLHDADAAIVLPALLPSFEKGGWSAGASIRSGIEGLSEISAAANVSLPWKNQIGLGVQHTGIEGYSEQRITFSYARRLFQKLNAAIQFDLNRNAAEEYDDIYVPSFAISFVAPLMDELSMSAWLYNPIGDITVLDLSTMARFGILYAPGEKVRIALEAEKHWKHDLTVKAGITYQLHRDINIRWGVGTSPSLIHAGISWAIVRRMAVNGGWRYHPVLGSSLSAGISQLQAN